MLPLHFQAKVIGGQKHELPENIFLDKIEW